MGGRYGGIPIDEPEQATGGRYGGEPAVGEPQDSFLDNTLDVLGEFSGAGSRAILENTVDLPSRVINEGLYQLGSESRVPVPTDYMTPVLGGNNMEPGLARDLVQTAGGFATPAVMATAPIKARNLATVSGAVPEMLGFGQAAKAGPAFAAADAAITPGLDRKSLDRARNPGAARHAEMRPDPATVGTKTVPDYIPDVPAKTAVSSGVEPGMIGLIKGSTPEAKSNMAEMIEIARSGLRDWGNRTKRPMSVVGRRIGEVVENVAGQKKEAGDKLNVISTQVLPGRAVDLAKAKQEFLQKIAAAGVEVTDDGLVFARSAFRDNPGNQRLINNAYRDAMSEGDALFWHRTKQAMDGGLDYGGRVEGTSAPAEMLVKEFRKGINDAVSAVSTEYADANTAYSKTKQALDAVWDVARKSEDLPPELRDSNLGTYARRLSNNTVSREQLINALGNLDEVSTIGNAYDDAFRTSEFDSLLNQLIGPQESKSLEGIMARTAGRAVTDGKLGAAKGAVDELRALSTPDQEQVMDALMQLVTRPN